MKNFTIKTVEDYNKFCYLSLKEKEQILKKIEKILKIDETKRFKLEKKKLENFNTLIDYLDSDSLTDNLDYKKKETFRLINRTRFINKLYIDIDAFNTFFFNYFFTKNRYYYDDLNILLQAVYIYLMNYFNFPFTDINIKKKQKNYTISYLHQKMYLDLPQNILDNASSNIIDEETFLKLAVKETWSLTHEFAHTGIYRYLERSQDEKSPFFKEIVITYFANAFYENNHNDFSSEICANSFAKKFTYYLLKDIVDPIKLQEELNLIEEKQERDKTRISSREISATYEKILKKNGKEKTLKLINEAFQKEN